MIAIPGFVDTHRHLWEGLLRNAMPDDTLKDYFEKVINTLGPACEPEYVYLGTLVSALGALNAGVTTVLDWAHCQNTSEHTDASIAALQASGMRAVFGFGTPTATDRGHRHPHDIVRLRKEVFSSDDQLLTLALATNSPEYAPYEETKANWQIAREAGARITVHAAMEGLLRARPDRTLWPRGLAWTGRDPGSLLHIEPDRLENGRRHGNDRLDFDPNRNADGSRRASHLACHRSRP